MKLTSKKLFLATIVIATCGYASIAAAQTTAPVTATDSASAVVKPAAPKQMQDRMHRTDANDAQKHKGSKYQDRMAKRQAELKAKLKITPAQEGAWTTFTAAMQPTHMAGGMKGMRHDPTMKAEMQKLTTPERIDKMRALRADHMAKMSAEMDKRGEATKSFYAALSSEQKAVFDAITPRGGRHGGGHGGHGGHHGDHGNKQGKGGERK